MGLNSNPSVETAPTVVELWRQSDSTETREKSTITEKAKTNIADTETYPLY